MQRILLIEWLGMQNMVDYNKKLRVINSMKNMKSDNFLIRYAGNLSDQSNPVLQKMYRILSDLDAAKTFEWNDYVTELRKHTAKKDISNIIDKKNKRLIQKYDNSFTKEIYQSKYDANVILKHFSIPESYNYDELLKDYKAILDTLYKDENGQFSHANLKNGYDFKLKEFIKNHQIYDKDGKYNKDAIAHLYRSRALQIKNKETTAEYNALSPDLKESLDWFLGKNEYFREMLDITNETELSDSFIPLVRKDLIDRWRDSEGFTEFFLFSI